MPVSRIGVTFDIVSTLMWVTLAFLWFDDVVEKGDRVKLFGVFVASVFAACGVVESVRHFMFAAAKVAL